VIATCSSRRADAPQRARRPLDLFVASDKATFVDRFGVIADGGVLLGPACSMSVPRRSWPKPHLHQPDWIGTSSGVPAHEQIDTGFRSNRTTAVIAHAVSLQRPLMFRDRSCRSERRSHRRVDPRSARLRCRMLDRQRGGPLRASSRVMRWSNTARGAGDVPQSRGVRADRQPFGHAEPTGTGAPHFNAVDLPTPDSNVVFVSVHDRLRRSNAAQVADPNICDQSRCV